MSGPAHCKELVERVAKVRAALEAVPKNGFNKHGGYPFANVDDVYHATRKIMAKHEVEVHAHFDRIETKTRPGKKGDVLWLFVWSECWLSCPEGSERPVGRFHGTPYSGPQSSEAVTSYLVKQFLRSRLQLETGEYDVDELPHEEPPPRGTFAVGPDLKLMEDGAFADERDALRAAYIAMRDHAAARPEDAKAMLAANVALIERMPDGGKACAALVPDPQEETQGEILEDE